MKASRILKVGALLLGIVMFVATSAFMGGFPGGGPGGGGPGGGGPGGHGWQPDHTGLCFVPAPAPVCKPWDKKCGHDGGIFGLSVGFGPGQFPGGWWNKPPKGTWETCKGAAVENFQPEMLPLPVAYAGKAPNSTDTQGIYVKTTDGGTIVRVTINGVDALPSTDGFEWWIVYLNPGTLKYLDAYVWYQNSGDNPIHLTLSWPYPPTAS